MSRSRNTPAGGEVPVLRTSALLGLGVLVLLLLFPLLELRSDHLRDGHRGAVALADVELDAPGVTARASGF